MVSKSRIKLKGASSVRIGDKRMFIGRARELERLNDIYRSNRFELAAIYGPMGVGKTAFTLKFTEGKRAIFFKAVETSAKQNLRYFTGCVRDFEAGNTLGNAVFSTFQEAMERVFQLAVSERLVLVIDDYPSLARASKNLNYSLPSLIEKYADSTRLMLILSGSVSGISPLLGEKSPLRRFQTAEISLPPLNFAEVSSWFSNYSPEDKVLAYGMLGGMPRHLSQFNEQLGIKENVMNTFMDSNSRLFAEPMLLLRREFREPATYNAILTAISSGDDSLTNIAKAIDESSSSTSVYLKSLISRGFIRKANGFEVNGRSRNYYCIEDNFLRFWYRFVPDFLSTIACETPDDAYNRLESKMDVYMADVFMDVCRRFLLAYRENGRCPVEFKSLGCRVSSSSPIDFVGFDESSALFAVCRWTDQSFDLSELTEVISIGEEYGYEKSFFYVFSRNGFSDRCVSYSLEREDIILVSFK